MPEEEIGRVIKFFAKPMVAAIEVTAGSIRVGDTLRFVGHTTEFETEVSSIQEEHQSLEEAHPGQKIGLKVPDRVREGDRVVKLT
ncbi:MAG: translation elongation factor-like protein [Proteobacteria bacterium]|nr:translation elongation factor-like protein [Pseudomonadota bacterium]MBU1742050.1 translation elongation factor-like protein [Pseudomonadota bacterium]